jgi:hypothetical protein
MNTLYSLGAGATAIFFFQSIASQKLLLELLKFILVGYWLSSNLSFKVLVFKFLDAINIRGKTFVLRI